MKKCQICSNEMELKPRLNWDNWFGNLVQSGLVERYCKIKVTKLEKKKKKTWKKYWDYSSFILLIAEDPVTLKREKKLLQSVSKL